MPGGPLLNSMWLRDSLWGPFLQSPPNVRILGLWVIRLSAFLHCNKILEKIASLGWWFVWAPGFSVFVALIASLLWAHGSTVNHGSMLQEEACSPYGSWLVKNEEKPGFQCPLHVTHVERMKYFIISSQSEANWSILIIPEKARQWAVHHLNVQGPTGPLGNLGATRASGSTSPGVKNL